MSRRMPGEAAAIMLPMSLNNKNCFNTGKSKESHQLTPVHVSLPCSYLLSASGSTKDTRTPGNFQSCYNSCSSVFSTTQKSCSSSSQSFGHKSTPFHISRHSISSVSTSFCPVVTSSHSLPSSATILISQSLYLSICAFTCHRFCLCVFTWDTENIFTQQFGMIHSKPCKLSPMEWSWVWFAMCSSIKIATLEVCCMLPFAFSVLYSFTTWGKLLELFLASSWFSPELEFFILTRENLSTSLYVCLNETLRKLTKIKKELEKLAINAMIFLITYLIKEFARISQKS